MSITFPLIDAQTGYEIIAFVRRGRWYWYLRHPRTKRFIRRIRELSIKITVTVEYSEEEAQKKNPLYVDMTVSTTLRDHFEPRDILETQDVLIDVAHREISAWFGVGIVHISEVVGIEYFSKRITKVDFPEVKVDLIWWHRSEVDSREEEYYTSA